MKLTALALMAAFGLTVALPSMAAEPAAPEAGKPKHERPKHDMFEKVDTNKDGVITKDESVAFHDKMFARKDLNKDGKITKEEAEKAREQWKAEHKADKAAKDLNK